MDSGYLESYAWIYAQASDLDQGVVLWGIDSFTVKFFLKILRLAALRRLGSNLFH